MPVVLDAESLHKGRLGAVQVMLRPLGRAGHPVPCRFAPHPRMRIICGHGGGFGKDYKTIWFPTSSAAIQAQYHEIWYPQNGEQEWWMERAYFSLRRIVSALAKVEEILCVHSDPMCEDAEPTGSYKKGPHLHVIVPKSPIAKAHFPLNLGHLKYVLASCDNLSQAMSLAIQVVQDEVVNRF